VKDEGRGSAAIPPLETAQFAASFGILSAAMTTTAAQGCPRCNIDLPVDEGYVTWCHQCGWNLSPPKRETPSRRLDRLYARLGRRLGDQLVGEMLAVERLEPRLTPGKLTAYVISALVYGLTLALIGGGIALAWLAWPNVVAIALAALMVGVGLLMRPRLGECPKKDLVSRSEGPSLYALADEVAQALGVKPVDVIVADRDFNASWAVLGLRRRRVLSLGLPLVAVLEPQERVALIAHELAHARNGDATRGLFVGSAVNGLAALYWLLSPEDREDSGDGLGADLIAKAILWVVSRPVWLLLVLQLHLLTRDMQRAEYLADALAARVAGTEAVVAIQEKLLLEHTVWATLQHAAGPAGEQLSDLLEDIGDAVLRVPDRERERRRRVARLEEARLGETHPPSGKRIELLEGRPQLEPEVLLDADRSSAIDAELAGRRTAAGRQLLEEYREAIYG
jgi:Zn-dependent protease with chaperone function